MRTLLASLFLFFGAARVTEPALPPRDGPLTSRVARPPIVWIEGGSFVRGTSERNLERSLELCQRIHGGPSELCDLALFVVEMPASRIFVSAFGIDRTEVTNAAYRRCIAAGACDPPRISDADPRVGSADRPVAGVTYSEAARYCAWVSGRLPTEAEWERAARGDDERQFPWGDAYSSALANHNTAFFSAGLPRRLDAEDGFRHSAPVGSYPSGASPFGLLDMAGNVWEWTSDPYGDYANDLAVDPRGRPASGDRVIRGGSWGAPAYMMRTAHRARFAEADSSPEVGFRCAYDADG